MAFEHLSRFNQTPLAGARIWLSGAIPDPGSYATSTSAIDLTAFVRDFARHVFERGGYIVHGSHPSLTPTLLDVARHHRLNGGRRDCLILGVSRRWSKGDNALSVNACRDDALVYETPEARDGGDTASLTILREWMAARCDAVVVVGGKVKVSTSTSEGIPEELQLAVQRGLPVFILGGFGGAAGRIAVRSPAVFAHLRNGLDADANAELTTRADPATLAADLCASLQRLPLVRGRGSDGGSFRILALDGGGVRGAFTAAVLASWEAQTGLRVVDHFDMIAGTSTGGILALGLGLELPSATILKFYKERGPVIFPIMGTLSKPKRLFRHLFRPAYSQHVLHDQLSSAYARPGKGSLMKDSRCRLVIPAYHAVAGASHVFRTPHHPDLTHDGDTDIAAVGVATAAAPTFFSAAPVSSVATSDYFDGGVWANSPALAAVVEAVCFLHVPIERIDILSVGTTTSPFTVRHQTRAGILAWVWQKRILDLLMNVQQESSLRLAKHLVTAPRFLRVDAVTKPGEYPLDAADDIGALSGLGERTANDPDVLCQVKSRFLNGIPASHWESYP